MGILKLVLLLSLLGTTLNACKNEVKKVVKTAPITFTKEGELNLIKKDVDTLITTLAIEFAESDYETQTGLMYRKSMRNDQGMLFVFKEERMHSFYMKNTEIPLDIIYIKADSTIASFKENAEPFNETGLSSEVPIQYVLEVNAGLAEKWLLEVGDRIKFRKN